MEFAELFKVTLSSECLKNFINLANITLVPVINSYLLPWPSYLNSNLLRAFTKPNRANHSSIVWDKPWIFYSSYTWTAKSPFAGFFFFFQFLWRFYERKLSNKWNSVISIIFFSLTRSTISKRTFPGKKVLIFKWKCGTSVDHNTVDL